MIPAFRAIRTAVRDIQKLQDALSKVFNSILSKEILDGRLITGIVLSSSGTNEVDHGLGKPIRGWVVVAKNANANIYDSVSSTPNATLILTATANVTISLWVF